MAPLELTLQGAKLRLEYWQAVLANAGANDAHLVREAADFIQQYSKLIAEMVGIDSHPG
jgi:hypothetical protein